MALAIVLDEFRLVAPVVVAVHALLSWPSVLPLYVSTYAWRLEKPNWSAALRITPEETYLLEARDDHQMVRRLDAIVPRGEAISPAIGNSAYHTRNLIGPFESRLGNRSYEMLFRATTDDLRTTLRLRFKFSPVEARRLRVVMTARNDQPLLIGEIRLWREGQELPRDPSWRLRASVNPWEVQRAFDGSPLTVWTVGQDCSGYVCPDRSRGETNDRRGYRGCPRGTEDGPTWVSTSKAATANGRTYLARPFGESGLAPLRMRRAAIEEMKASGFRRGRYSCVMENSWPTNLWNGQLNGASGRLSSRIGAGCGSWNNTTLSTFLYGQTGPAFRIACFARGDCRVLRRCDYQQRPGGDSYELESGRRKDIRMPPKR